MVTPIPNVQNWTVTPQNGQPSYFTLMNTWLGQSTLVIASLQTAIVAQNKANSEINALAIQAENNAIIATGLANFQGDWSNAVTYSKGQSVESTTGSKIYYTSKVDNNLNHSVADTNYWLYNPINDKVNNSGNETISGIKTFNSDSNFKGIVTIDSTDSSATIGTEMLTNGTFTGNTTGWVLGTNWTYSSNAVVCTLNASAEGTLSQNVSVVLDNYYLLEWYQTNSIDTNGQITPSLGAVVGGKHSSGITTQVYQQIFRATSTGSVSLSFVVTDITGTGTITIDSVSLKQITPMKPSMILNNAENSVEKLELRTSKNVGTNHPNIGIGNGALRSNTTGIRNVALGGWALSSNTTGYNNTASGAGALQNNTTGYSNTASGVAALNNNTTGYSNTASGVHALYNNTTGTNNTASGVNALYNNTTFSNVSGFGFNSQVTGSNQVQLGDSATITYVYGTVQNRSDIRDKADIRDTVLGLDFIQSLRPVDYRWDMREDYKPERPELEVPKIEDEEYEVKKAEYDLLMAEWLEGCKHENIIRDGSKKRTRYHQGFIAQEVMALGVEFGGIQDHSIEGGDDVLSIGYDELIAPMVKAIQEQQNMISELILRVKTLEEK